MKKVINSLPVPAAGLMLGLASAGNLVSSHSSGLKIFFGILSAMILVLLVTKTILSTRAVMEDMKNPAIAGIAGALPMGIMVLSAYVQPLSHWTGYLIWAVGILAHFILIIYFTKRFIFSFNMEKVFPSYFVVYIGIAAASITAPLFGAEAAGRVLFWFGFIAYLVLLPVVACRVFVVKPLPEPLLPTITIFAAPPGLCLVGYLNSFPEKNMAVVWLLTFLSLITLFAVLSYMPRMLKLKFYPSYAAFTFPLVISAIAMKSVISFFVAERVVVPAFGYIAPFEELLALVFVVYVLVRYIVFMSRVSLDKNVSKGVTGGRGC